MHFRTHVKPESKGQAGRWQSGYHDAMIDHDKLVGELLGLLDELGLAEDTIVISSTGNGPHMNSWLDAGTTPFRGEKNTNWEGAYRVPAVVRWPERIPARTALNSIVSHNDWLATLLAAVRYDIWTMVFLEQRVTGTLQVWAEPFVQLRVLKIFNLRTDAHCRSQRVLDGSDHGHQRLLLRLH